MEKKSEIATTSSSSDLWEILKERAGLTDEDLKPNRKEVIEQLAKENGFKTTNEIIRIVRAWNDLQSSSTDSLLKKFNRLEKKIDLIGKESIIHKRKRLDAWTPSKKSKTEQKEFKEALIDYYQRADPNQPNNLFCMILNRSIQRDQVIASHIWKFATHGEGLEEFGLDKSDVSSPRNGLLLAKPIENAFDSKQVCFCYDPFNKKLKLEVLDPSIMEAVVYAQTKFKDINGHYLHHPQDCNPFRRILSWHAKLAFELAKNRNWIDENKFKLFVDFADLSTGASIPDFGDNQEEEEEEEEEEKK